MPRRALLWQIGFLQAMFCFAVAAFAAGGTLGDNQRISSAHLGYDLQYRIYRPAAISASDKLPSLYLTDGQWYLEPGDLISVLDNAISAGLIKPLLVVFLDSRDPDDLEVNRRNSQFMCSTDFAAFFADELIPTISRDQPVSLLRDDRVIMGLSFGALNSACFGLMLPNLFSGVAMQSPASGDHVDVVRDLYEKREPLPLKMFLSVGTRNDNTRAAKRFRQTLEDKGYDLTFIQVQADHSWQNWGPLLDDALITFFAQAE